MYGKMAKKGPTQIFSKMLLLLLLCEKKKSKLILPLIYSFNQLFSKHLLSGPMYQQQPEVRQIPALVAFGGSRCHQRHARPFVTNFAKLISL